MARRSTPRNPLFDGRWFEDEIIILCLRWYFRYKLSYRDLVEMIIENLRSQCFQTTVSTASRRSAGYFDRTGTVILTGEVTRPTLKDDAERVVKRIEGVERVDNRIRVLPLSPFDDRLRVAAFRAI